MASFSYGAAEEANDTLSKSGSGRFRYSAPEETPTPETISEPVTPKSASYQVAYPTRDGVTGEELPDTVVDELPDGEAKSIKGFKANFRENFRDVTSFEDNDSLMKHFVQWAHRKLDPEYDNKKAQIKAREGSKYYLSTETEEAMDQLDQMTEQGQVDSPEFAQLEDQVVKMIEQDNAPEEEAELSFKVIQEAVTSNPGAAVAEMASAMIEDPEYLLLGYGGATKLGTALSKIAGSGTKAAQVAKAAGTVGGASATDAAIAASHSAMKSLNEDGMVDLDRLKTDATLGAAGGAVLGSGIVGFRAIKKAMPNNLSKQIEKTADDYVKLAEHVADQSFEQVSLSRAMMDAVEMKPAISNADKAAKRQAMRRVLQKNRRPRDEAGFAALKEAEITASTREALKGRKAKFQEFVQKEAGILGKVKAKANIHAQTARNIQEIIDETTGVTGQANKKPKDTRAALKEASEPGQNGESLKQFYERMARDADTSRAFRRSMALDTEVRNLAKIHEEKRMMWAIREQQRALDIEQAKRGMLAAQHRISAEKRAIQEEVTNALNANIDLTPPNSTMARAMRDADVVSDAGAFTRDILAKAARQTRIQEAGNIDPKLLAYMGGAGLAALGTYAAWEADMMKEAAAVAFVTVGAGFGVPVLSKAVRKTLTSKAVGNITDIVDPIIEPISDTIKKISPVAWGRLRKGEAFIQEMSKRLQQDVFNLTGHYKFKNNKTHSGKEAELKELWVAMLNGDAANIKRLHLAIGGKEFYKHYKEGYRFMMDSLHEKQKSLGSSVPYRQDYSPRLVKDFDGLVEHLNREKPDFLQKLKAKKKKTLGRELTDAEEIQIVRKFLEGSVRGKESMRATAGHLKQRSSFKVTPDTLKFFAGPEEALSRYVTSSLEEINWRSFIGKTVSKKRGDDIAGSIDDIVIKEGLDAESARKLASALKARFNGGRATMNPLLAHNKNLTQAALLGNYESTLTQTADVFLGVVKNGFVNTATSLLQIIRGKSRLDAREIGLVENIAQELIDSDTYSITKRMADMAFKASGFKAMDSLGKRSIVNGSVVKFQRRAKSVKGQTKIRKQYEHVLGTEATDQLISDLKNKVITDDVKFLAFNDLADIQPNTMLEMPEFWLNHPNGRALYSLKTYSMKFINLARRSMMDDIREGNVGAGLVKLAWVYSIASLGAFTADSLKNIIFDKGLTTDELLAEGLLKGTGIMSRYTAREIGKSSSPFTDMIADQFSIVSPLGDVATRAIMDLSQKGEIQDYTKSTMIRDIPFFGKLMYHFFGGGIEAEAMYGSGLNGWTVNSSQTTGGGDLVW